MADIKKKMRKIQLAMIFAIIVFLILLVTMFVVFSGIFILQKLGFNLVDEISKVPLLTFAIVSVSVGTVLAFLFSRLPLKPIRTVCEAADKIAEGDYSVRINLKGPTEFIQLTDSFNHMAEELCSVEMLRSDFVNNFSHEFKTPIVSVRGFAKMLKRDDLTEEERNEYLDTIITESERLAELSTNVLNLTKIEQQTILTDKRLFNVSEQLRLVIAMLSEKWLKKQLEFDFDCGEIYLTGNEEMLKQVWINLLDNAIKFSPDGGAVIIKLRRTAKSVIITVSNEGNILTEESAKHIFDKFYQADKSHAARGYGLGLAITKQIIELHSGTITAKGTEDSRIEFRIELPKGS